MPAREDSDRASAVNPVTLESIAGISSATLQVRTDAGLGAVELHIDGVPVLLLSSIAAGALISALIEGLTELVGEGEP
jgi:hypothetical protein